jgi:hypothetical protein
VNRRERRRAAALNRGRRGYLHRILAGGGLTELTAGKRGLFLTTIEHDADCAIYRRGPCTCVPDISIKSPDGTVSIIDEHGQVASKTRVS